MTPRRAKILIVSGGSNASNGNLGRNFWKPTIGLGTSGAEGERGGAGVLDFAGIEGVAGAGCLLLLEFP